MGSATFVTFFVAPPVGAARQVIAPVPCFFHAPSFDSLAPFPSSVDLFLPSAGPALLPDHALYYTLPPYPDTFAAAVAVACPLVAAVVEFAVAAVGEAVA